MTRSKEKATIIVDIDGTIADTEVDNIPDLLIRSYNFFVFGRIDAFFKPVLDSLEVLKKLAEKYEIVYLTSRVSVLGIEEQSTKFWLDIYGFPKGELYLRNSVEDLDDALEFKKETIAKLKKEKRNIIAGIGNRILDAKAYLENDIRAIILNNTKRLPEGAELVDSWLDIECMLL